MIVGGEPVRGRRQRGERRRDRRDALGQGQRTRACRGALRLVDAARRRASATASTTAAVGAHGAATKQKDALEIGAPAAGGAIIGALIGGKKGALIGTAVGGGAGTAVVLSTRGKEVHLPRGTRCAAACACGHDQR